ncbi:cytosine deaminase [Flagelloscypha sp. PMI_526]|nr:cytosine deaminase [Flagelloscypha sp. PMI_526]
MLLPPGVSIEPTPPTPRNEITSFDEAGLAYALAEAMKGYEEGGVPIGAALGVQMNSAIRHGERLSASVYKKCTMFTTLSPCTMCTGAIILYGIPRIVIGENTTFVGGEDILRSRGVEIVNLDDANCTLLMEKFIKEKPDVWNEDIGEQGSV